MQAPVISSSVESEEHVRKSQTAIVFLFFLELDYKACHSTRYREYGKYWSEVIGHLVIYNRKECRMHTARNTSLG